jgi:hypothetical protein
MIERMIVNAQQRHRSYSGLAHAYATHHDGWMATHAQLASDVLAAEIVLLENRGMPEVYQFRDTLTEALQVRSIPLARASDVAEQARGPVGRALPRDLEPIWKDRLNPLDFLYPAGVLFPAQSTSVREERLGSLNEAAFVLSKREEQSASMTTAMDCTDAGDEWGAVEAVYTADLAAFESWLVQRSVTRGDANLIQTELLWALGLAAVQQIAQYPTAPAAAAFMTRSRLAWAVGFEEVRSLADAFADLP